MVRFHAAELSRVDLDDALAVCLVFLRSEPAAWDRAAGRWLGRLCVERSLGLRDAILAGACLDALGRGEQEGAYALRTLCQRLTLRGAVTWLDRWVSQQSEAAPTAP